MPSESSNVASLMNFNDSCVVLHQNIPSGAPNLYPNVTNSFPVWDPQRFRDIIFGWSTSTALPASYLAEFSSFTQFGRKPACSAAFSSFKATSPTTTTVYTANEWGPGQIQVCAAGWPLGYCCQGVSLQIGPRFCCPQCILRYTHLQALYWPAAHPNTACLKNATRVASASSVNEAEDAAGIEVYATETDGFV